MRGTILRDVTLTGVLVVCMASFASVLRAVEGSWSQGAAMLTARSEIAVAELGGRIYAAGGITLWGTTGVFEVYNPARNRWRTLAPMPEARHHLAMAPLGGRIYLTGGYADLSFRSDRKSAWVYEPEMNQWRPIAAMPAPRAAHKLVAVAGKLYVVGGVGPDPLALWAYDPEKDRWETSLEPLPTAREHLAAATIGGKLYVIAGR